LGNLQPDIANGGEVRFRDAADKVGNMHAADSASSNYCDVHFSFHIYLFSPPFLKGRIYKDEGT
jgi:hypothetical protein